MKATHFLAGFLLVAVHVPAVGYAQDNRLLTRGSKEQFLDSARRMQEWRDAKKITLLKPDQIPVEPPSSSINFDKIEKEWVGEISSREFRVLNILSNNEVLLKSGDLVIWIVGYSTAELTDDQIVRVVGPIKAGETRSYDNLLGGKTTVRTFRLIDGLALESYIENQASSVHRKEISAYKPEYLGQTAPQDANKYASCRASQVSKYCQETSRAI